VSTLKLPAWPVGRLRSARLALALGTGALVLLGVAWSASAPAPPATNDSAQEQAGLLDKFCSRCHNDERLSGNLTFSTLSAADLSTGTNLEQWEKILRMTSRGEMPPRSRPQPSPEARASFTHWLGSSLDRYAAAHPNPGRATIRRLNRAEYANAVRDLLALDVDVSSELPADDSGYGFDNIADVSAPSSRLSPATPCPRTARSRTRAFPLTTSA
jgi:uncharacterized protein DUF1587